MSFDPATEKYVNLATFRKDGREVRTPVWIAPHSNRYYVFSEAAAGKVKRIRNNGQARLAPCDLRGNLLRDEWLDARAWIEKDPAVIAGAYKGFDAKYGLVMKLTNFFSRLTGRYGRRAIIGLELNPESSND